MTAAMRQRGAPNPRHNPQERQREPDRQMLGHFHRVIEILKQTTRPIKGPPPVHLWKPPYCGDIGIRIAGDGTWFYAGSPIGRKPLVALFASVLRKDEDGLTYLVTPVEKVLVTVDDAPFMAVEMTVSGSGHGRELTLRTNVDDWVTAGRRIA